MEEACDVLDDNGRRETYSSGKEEVERTYPEVVRLLNQRYYNTTVTEKSNNQRENIFLEWMWDEIWSVQYDH